MRLQHIIAAADESEQGRAAIVGAVNIAARSRARVTVLRVAAERPVEEATTVRLLQELRERGRSAVAGLAPPPPLDQAVVFGLPGVEISRYAETHRGDLVVIGHKRRTERQRILLGDTADAVARRSDVPTLFMPAGPMALDRMLVALDGTERGLTVLSAGMDFTRSMGTRLRVVSVEPEYTNESGVVRVLTSRSEQLVEAVHGLRGSADLSPGRWDDPGIDGERGSIVVQRGAVVEAVLREIELTRSDILTVGFHRGGPAGVIDAGSVGRRLLHEAPVAVLTIPL
jgi:nucleotide-binding universal stress UspA family protein